ncbi:hypothetical protein LCGC14_2459610, partial [marine sediment metagenome]
GLVDISSGVGTLSINDTVAETVNLSLNGGGGLDISSTQDVLFSPGPATQFVILDPADSTAGTATTVTVQALDTNNNVDTSYGTGVTLVAGGSATGGGLVDIVSGVGTLSINDTVAETVNLTLTDSEGTGLTVSSTQNVVFSPGAASYLKVTGNASMTAGGSNELTIKAYDANNNLATGYIGTKSLTFSGPATAPDDTVPTVETTAIGTAVDVTFTAGVSNANAATLIAYKAEVTEVDVSDGSLNSTGDASYDLDLTVTPGAANNLAYSQQPGNTVAGSAITPAVTVEVRDEWNNVRTSDNSTSVAVAINNNPGSGTLSGTTPRTAASGVATFNDLSIDKSGDGYTLDATSGGLTTATSSGFNITSPTIQFTSASSGGAESATPVTLQLTLSAASGLDVSVDYALSGTATGGGTDYSLAAGTATITAGSTTTNINLTIVNDLLVEADETIIVTLSNPTNATLGTNTVHTYTINDNDDPPTIQFTSTSSSGAESATPVILQLTLSAVSGLDVSVD